MDCDCPSLIATHLSPAGVVVVVVIVVKAFVVVVMVVVVFVVVEARVVVVAIFVVVGAQSSPMSQKVYTIVLDGVPTHVESVA